MTLGLWAGLALFVVLLVVIFALVRTTSKLAREEERHEYEQRQTKAREADQERADDIAKKADDAAVAIKKDAARVGRDGAALADRLRGSGRGRTPKD